MLIMLKTPTDICSMVAVEELYSRHQRLFFRCLLDYKDICAPCACAPYRICNSSSRNRSSKRSNVVFGVSTSSMHSSRSGKYLGVCSHPCHCTQETDAWLSGTVKNLGRIFLKGSRRTVTNKIISLRLLLSLIWWW